MHRGCVASPQVGATAKQIGNPGWPSLVEQTRRKRWIPPRRRTEVAGPSHRGLSTEPAVVSCPARRLARRRAQVMRCPVAGGPPRPAHGPSRFLQSKKPTRNRRVDQSNQS